MKILIVGGTGLLGREVVKQFHKDHEILIASKSNGDIAVDISDPKSIETMYEKAGPINAVCCCTGKVAFAPFADMNMEQIQEGIHDKLLGQIYLVKIGLNYLEKGGSFTLISGILNIDPIYKGTSAATVNGALDSFVFASSFELREKFRINIVSPTVFKEAMESYAPFFPGYKPIPVKEAALAYQKSVEGYQTGQVFRVGY